MTMTRLIGLLGFLLLTSTYSAAARAEEPAASAATTDGQATSPISKAERAKAERFIKGKHNAVRKVLRKPNTPKRAEELTEVLGEFLNYDELAKLSLDTEWKKRSKKQRAKFVSLLRQLVERQYQRNMESTLNYSVKWVGSEDIEGGVLVKSSARSKKKKRTPPVEIDYAMSEANGEWSVFDISTDGVSLVRNYKRQFRRIIRKEGWDGLIGRMERKLNANPDDELF